MQARTSKFSRDIEEGVKKYKDDKKAHVKVVRKAWCGLGQPCMADIVESFSSYVTPGGLVESLLKSQLGDMDVKMLGPALLMYYESYCSKADHEEL